MLQFTQGYTDLPGEYWPSHLPSPCYSLHKVTQIYPGNIDLPTFHPHATVYTRLHRSTRGILTFSPSIPMLQFTQGYTDLPGVYWPSHLPFPCYSLHKVTQIYPGNTDLPTFHPHATVYTRLHRSTRGILTFSPSTPMLQFTQGYSDLPGEYWPSHLPSPCYSLHKVTQIYPGNIDLPTFHPHATVYTRLHRSTRGILTFSPSIPMLQFTQGYTDLPGVYWPSHLPFPCYSLHKVTQIYPGNIDLLTFHPHATVYTRLHRSTRGILTFSPSTPMLQFTQGYSDLPGEYWPSHLPSPCYSLHKVTQIYLGNIDLLTFHPHAAVYTRLHRSTWGILTFSPSIPMLQFTQGYSDLQLTCVYVLIWQGEGRVCGAESQVRQTGAGSNGRRNREPDEGSREETQHALHGLGRDSTLPRRLITKRQRGRRKNPLNSPNYCPFRPKRQIAVVFVVFWTVEARDLLVYIVNAS